MTQESLTTSMSETLTIALTLHSGFFVLNIWTNKARTHQRRHAPQHTNRSPSLGQDSPAKTIPLLEGSNVALFRSAAGYKNAFSAISESPQPVCFTSPHVIPNDVEESDKTNNVPTESKGESDK